MLSTILDAPLTWNVYLDWGITLFIFLFVWLIAKKYLQNKMVFFVIFFAFVLQLIADFFELSLFSLLLQLVSFSIIAAFCVIYSQEIRRLLTSKSGKSGFFGAINEIDKDLFFKEINDTVLTLSATKTGAIITFEKHDNLDHYAQSGEPVEAPISSELLRTIFYPGTPLHDGAVIIRGMTIVAASVYYSPTLKALRGKYGARHRAALGISEVTDALTVVVSEETGRISLAKNGEITVVNRDNFAEVLSENLQ